MQLVNRKHGGLIGLGLLLSLSWIPILRAAHSPQWIWEDSLSSHGVSLDMSASGNEMVVGTSINDDHRTVLAYFNQESAFPVSRIEYTSNFGIGSVSISDDGIRYACALINEVRVYQAPETVIFAYSDDDLTLSHVALNADGSKLLVTSVHNQDLPGRLLFFDVDTQTLEWQDDPSEDVSVNGAYAPSRISADGTRVLALFAGRQMGNPAYAVLYQTDAVDPGEPVWITQPLEAWGRQIEMSADGNFFIAILANIISYFDMSPPVDGIKTPIWEAEGGGYETLYHSGGISDNGSVVAHFGETSTGSWVEIYDGADGSIYWMSYLLLEEIRGCVSGNGTRVAFSSWENPEPVNHFVYDIEAGSVIWSEPGYGLVAMNTAGDRIFITDGSGAESPPTRLMSIEENLPPQCSIESPLPGETVSGIVHITGMVADVDDLIARVEVLLPVGVTLANAPSGASGEWSADIDVSAYAGSLLLIKARAIDTRFKHGQWSEVGVAVVDGGTPTPVPTETPSVVTPTPPSSNDVTLALILSQNLFMAGDMFWLDAMIDNPNAPLLGVPLVVLLEIHGAFFCWPSWSALEVSGEGFDYSLRNIPIGTHRFEIIQPFFWPETGGWGIGLLFYGVLLDPQFSSLLCDIDVEVWSYR